MIRGLDAAKYLLSKDVEGNLFDKSLTTKNGRSFYSGNARLNKYLHLAQNIYLAKTGSPLIDSNFYAYDNGAVAPEVQENYAVLLNQRKVHDVIPQQEQEFLDKIYTIFRNATLEELIDLSHEDSEWVDKHIYYTKEKQKMNSLERVDEYKKQYEDIVKIMDRMRV
jgi:uncharacterized phage-associated protein